MPCPCRESALLKRRLQFELQINCDCDVVWIELPRLIGLAQHKVQMDCPFVGESQSVWECPSMHKDWSHGRMVWLIESGMAESVGTRGFRNKIDFVGCRSTLHVFHVELY